MDGIKVQMNFADVTLVNDDDKIGRKVQEGLEEGWEEGWHVAWKEGRGMKVRIKVWIGMILGLFGRIVRSSAM